MVLTSVLQGDILSFVVGREAGQHGNREVTKIILKKLLTNQEQLWYSVKAVPIENSIEP